MIALIVAAGFGLLFCTQAAAQQALPASAQAQLRQAASYIQAQQLSEAAEILNRLVAKYPRSADVREALAATLDMQGRVAEATPHFEQAAKLRPGSARAHLNLGANYFRLGKLEESTREFERALRLSPEDPAIQYNLGLLRLQQRKFDAALPHLRRAYEAQPSNPANAFQLALCHFFLRQYESAEKVLQPVAEQSEQGEVFLLRGLNARMMGRKEVATKALHRALELLPASPQRLIALAPAFIQLGLANELIPLLERAQQQNPTSYELAYNLALAYHRAGHDEQARLSADAALKTFSTPELHSLKGAIEEQAGNYTEAVKQFQRAAELAPTEENFYQLGYEFLAHWSWDAAAAVFQRALEIAPESERLRLGLATAYFGLAEYGQVVSTLLKAKPDSVLANRMLVAAYPNAPGSTAAVRLRLRQNYERNPRDPWANYFYAIALSQTPEGVADENELSQAAALLRRAVVLKGDAPEFQYQLGVLLSDQGNWREAVPALEAATKLGPGHAEAYYRLAQGYQRLGQAERAQAALVRYRELKEKRENELDQRAAQTTRFIYDLKQ